MAVRGTLRWGSCVVAFAFLAAGATVVPSHAADVTRIQGKGFGYSDYPRDDEGVPFPARFSIDAYDPARVLNLHGGASGQVSGNGFPVSKDDRSVSCQLTELSVVADQSSPPLRAVSGSGVGQLDLGHCEFEWTESGDPNYPDPKTGLRGYGTMLWVGNDVRPGAGIFFDAILTFTPTPFPY